MSTPASLASAAAARAAAAVRTRPLGVAAAATTASATHLSAAARRALSTASAAAGPASADARVLVRSADKAAPSAVDVWIAKTPDGPLGGTVARVRVDRLDHLVKRTSDSFTVIELPFGRDAALRGQFVNFRGQLRVGKLLEEIDACAAITAYRHCDDGRADTEAPTLVTASMDRVDLLTYPLTADRDLQLRAAVTYAGATSVNIEMDVVALPRPGDPPGTPAATPIMQASTTFVARNAHTGRGVPVPRLVPSTPAEAALFEAGRAANEARKAARGRSLDRQPPSPDELAMVHTMFSELSAAEDAAAVAAVRPGGPSPSSSAATAPPLAASAPVITTDDTLLTSHELTMPQDRNVHGKVFGGWLMRRAFETAWAAGWKATGALPKFLALDDISFQHPVEVGTLVRFDARLSHALGPPHKTYVVSVTATMSRPHEAADARLRSGLTTNTFEFTFYCDPDRIPRVYPRTYGEAMQFIQSHRRFRVGQALAEARRAAGGVALRFDEAGAAPLPEPAPLA
jgi:acyl-coenzyme A thioesterase 9